MKFIRKVLPNKVRVILAPMAEAKSVNLLVLAATGSKYETKEINGISHFIEHLFFKGTKNRPSTEQIVEPLDNIGAEHNAFTSREVTGYWVKAASKHFPLVLDIISDMVLNPIFNPDEIEKERKVILEEIKMRNDTPQTKIIELWEKTTYGDQPAGWPLAGTEKSIKAIKKNDIINYKENHYIGSNLLVVAAGDIDINQLGKIQEKFSKLKIGKKTLKQRIIKKQTKPQIYFEYKNTDQTHLVIGSTGYNLYDKKKYPAFLLDIILGGMMSSRFFKELREKLGLAYYVKTAFMPETDTGQFILRTGISNLNLPIAIDKIIEVLKDAKNGGISKKELDLAKENFRGRLALSFETSDEVADFLGEQEIFGLNIITPNELLKKVLDVKPEDVQKIANEMFQPNKINFALIGPHKNPELYRKKLANL